MRIGIAAPMTLDLLRRYLPVSAELPQGYPFPMTALLAGELIDRGHEVVAYTTSSDIAEPHRIVGCGLTLCIVPSRPQHRARNMFRDEIAGIRRAVLENPCEFLHAHWSYEFAIASLLSGVPTLVTVHDSARAIFLQFRDAYRLVRWGLNAYTLWRAPHLSAVSPYLWNTLPRAAKAKASIIPNFISERVAAGSFNSATESDYVIAVCNGFDRRKNLSNGLLGFRKALSACKDVRFVLVGAGCEPGGPAQRFCAANGCLENVCFMGPVAYDRVLDLVRNALVMLHPSYEESFGMSVLEAMALGTPVVAGTRSGNIPHLIEHGKTGYLCDVAEPASIGAALSTLLSDSTLRARISAAARQHVKDNYSASVVVNRYLDAYQRILGGQAIEAEACLCN